MDYPWSVAISLDFTYNAIPVTTASGTAVSIISGVGTRTYTNRFGASFSVGVTVATSQIGTNNNLLYLGAVTPLDTQGLLLNLASPTQLPGHRVGPTVLATTIDIFNPV